MFNEYVYKKQLLKSKILIYPRVVLCLDNVGLINKIFKKYSYEDFKCKFSRNLH